MVGDAAQVLAYLSQRVGHGDLPETGGERAGSARGAHPPSWHCRRRRSSGPPGLPPAQPPHVLEVAQMSLKAGEQRRVRPRRCRCRPVVGAVVEDQVGEDGRLGELLDAARYR